MQSVLGTFVLNVHARQAPQNRFKPPSPAQKIPISIFAHMALNQGKSIGGEKECVSAICDWPQQVVLIPRGINQEESQNICPWIKS
jgi:hypothetical protein